MKFGCYFGSSDSAASKYWKRQIEKREASGLSFFETHLYSKGSIPSYRVLSSFNINDVYHQAVQNKGPA